LDFFIRHPVSPNTAIFLTVDGIFAGITWPPIEALKALFGMATSHTRVARKAMEVLSGNGLSVIGRYLVVAPPAVFTRTLSSGQLSPIGKTARASKPEGISSEGATKV
jgi:hypothetical protein